MRTVPDHIWDLWNAGGPAIGDNGAPHGRITVEIDWFLNTSSLGSTNARYSVRKPFRYFQRADNSQVETEVPNAEVIAIDRSVDQDAATCKITLSNQWHFTNGEVQPANGDLGQPGYFTFNRGDSTDAQDRWGHAQNDWNDVIIPDALLRTYQGYGGKTKTIADAEADGNIVLTGVWLIDSVRLGTGGKVEIACRDMMKLLIEQQVYPPLMKYDSNPDNSLYPLTYSRWGFSDLSGTSTYLIGATSALLSGTQTTALLAGGSTSYNGAVPQPDYPDYYLNKPGNGYWLILSNGTLIGFGNKTSLGTVSTSFTTNPVYMLEESVLGDGYWILRHDGTINNFGDAPNYGSSSLDHVQAMARTYHGDGYWVISYWGDVESHGAAVWHGNCPTTVDPTNFWNSIICIDIASDPVGDGYWCMTNQGHVYAFGSAIYHGQPLGSTYPPNGEAIKTFAKIIAHPLGGGYWCMDQIGNVHAYGTAVHYGQLAGQAYSALGHNLPFEHPDFPDYMSGLIPTPSGKGYWLLGVSGGCYPFGDAVSFGAMDGPWEAHLRIDGNYTDYADIITDLAAWAGFWLYPNTSGGAPAIYGNIETTGAFASDRIDEEIFDKKPVIDPMTKLKEIVGYSMWVDDEGAFRFESPNVFEQGNFDEFGDHTDEVPNIDEAIQLTDYTVDYADKSARSEVIISTTDPTAALDDTITTRFTPSTSEILRGMVKPAMWVNGAFTIKREQEIMAELISLYIWLAQRQGSVTIMANPALQINDQVRIWERITSETYVHYIRGISSQMDLASGSYTMTLATHWMGDGSLWAVDLGLEPYEFTSITTQRELTYVKASNDLTGSLSPTMLTDGNLASSWRPRGGNNQLYTEAVEYVEFEVSGTVHKVGIYPFGCTTAYISVMVGGSWQGSSTIPYTPVGTPPLTGASSPGIRYVSSTSISSETPTVITLPSTYDAQRIRVTLRGFSTSDWGPFYYTGGLREVAAGV